MTAAQRTAAADGAPRIILASQSPRRRDLLSLIGIPHAVCPADIDETVRPGESPIACVERLACEKAERIAGAEGRGSDEAVIIAADTIVVIDDRILNKPVDVSDARAMLRLLQGRTHAVHTAVCVVRGARRAADLTTVGVGFRPLRDDEIDAYIATGEPMDKAGAYGIQGYGATIVDHIDGDFFAVMGLPLVMLVRLLGAVGVQYQFGRLGWGTAG
jgi:septum formation protein